MSLRKFPTDMDQFFIIGLVLLLGTLAVVMTGCSQDLYDGTNWSESAVAVIGGTVLATEGTMHLVDQSFTPPPTVLERVRRVFSPIASAYAQNICPTIDPGSTDPDIACDSDGNLVLFYHNCYFPDRNAEHHGYWRTYSLIMGLGSSTCSDILNQNTTFDQLSNTTVTRHFGLTAESPTQGADETNWRLSSNGTLVYLSTFYPSGWYDNTVSGGMAVLLDQSTGTPIRSISINGLHAKEYSVDPSYFRQLLGTTYSGIQSGNSFDLSALQISTTNGMASVSSDTSIDTQTLTTSGPNEIDNWQVIGSSTYDPIIVTGIGANRTLTYFKVRVQHNLSSVVTVSKMLSDELIARFQGNGLSLDTSAINWASDPNCCWPTEGEYLTNFYNTANMNQSYQSLLTRFTSSCGQVSMRYYSDLDAQGPLNEDNPQMHQLTDCF